MEKEVIVGFRPQDDVPQEIIERYMIKDYKRMYERHEALTPIIQQQKIRIINLNYAVKKAATKHVSDEEARSSLKAALTRAEKLEESLARSRNENKELKELCNKLSFIVEEMKKSREAITEAMTSELEEKLKEANRRIELLAQAVVEPEEADSIFLHQCKVHTIETDDDKKWMSSAMKQLEKAGMALLTTEERLVKYEEKLKESGNVYTEKVMKPLGRAISSISSTLSHIECFFDKVGDVMIAEDE